MPSQRQEIRWRELSRSGSSIMLFEASTFVLPVPTANISPFRLPVPWPLGIYSLRSRRIVLGLPPARIGRLLLPAPSPIMVLLRGWHPSLLFKPPRLRPSDRCCFRHRCPRWYCPLMCIGIAAAGEPRDWRCCCRNCSFDVVI